MDYALPTEAQREFLAQLVRVSAPSLAKALETQFKECLTVVEEFCPECFKIRATPGAVRIPSGSDNPLDFEVDLSGVAAEFAGVLLWHRNGIVDSVEIQYTGNDHPALSDLKLLSDH